jgi:hypothetical protein
VEGTSGERLRAAAFGDGLVGDGDRCPDSLGRTLRSWPPDPRELRCRLLRRRLGSGTSVGSPRVCLRRLRLNDAAESIDCGCGDGDLDTVGTVCAAITMGRRLFGLRPRRWVVTTLRSWPPDPRELRCRLLRRRLGSGTSVGSPRVCLRRLRLSDSAESIDCGCGDGDLDSVGTVCAASTTGRRPIRLRNLVSSVRTVRRAGTSACGVKTSRR